MEEEKYSIINEKRRSIMKNVCYYRSPIGVVFKIVDDGEYVKVVDFVENPCGCCLNSLPGELGRKVIDQLKEYFAGARKEFDLPLAPEGTQFQKDCWDALLKIPYGEVRSYKDIAKEVGCEKGARAVGNSNNKNPIAVIIPCHRVITSQGTLGGYGGGLEAKKALLDLEGSLCSIKGV